jgi:hypothetical protein
MWAFVDASDRKPDYAKYARDVLLRSEGLVTLRGESDVAQDFTAFFMSCDNDLVPSAIEAMLAALEECRVPFQVIYGEGQDLFRSVLVSVLREHRISYELIGSELVPMGSRELHSAVLVPALTLLGGREDLAGAEKAYMDALSEIHAKNGRAEDAITDAGTALQETLTALGLTGNALGPLIADARKKGLLAGHDGPLLEAVMKWVSADRSELGDTHHTTAPSLDDAWLLVHIVGALMVRLAQGGGRAKSR